MGRLRDTKAWYCFDFKRFQRHLPASSIPSSRLASPGCRRSGRCRSSRAEHPQNIAAVTPALREVRARALLRLAAVSVRRVEDITHALWGTRVIASTVSDLNQKIYGKINEWRERPLVPASG